MIPDQDPTRLLRAWLQEGPTAVPPHVLERVLDQIPTTQQRAARRRGQWLIAQPAARLNRSIGLGLVAAVVILALVGGQLWSAQQGSRAGASPQPSPSPTPTNGPTASPDPVAPTPLRVPGSPQGLYGPGAKPYGTGPLPAGTYAYFNFEKKPSGFNLGFTVPARWTWTGKALVKGGANAPGGAAIYFFTGPVQVYQDPCHWNISQAGQPGILAGLAEDHAFIDGLVGQAGRNATPPHDVDRNNGVTVELTVPASLNLATCDHGAYRSWGPDANARVNQAAGQIDDVWAFPDDLIVDEASFPGTPASVKSELDAIFQSITALHYG
jgi:hypothetical protein